MSNPSARANPLPSAPQWMRNVMWDDLVHIGANLCLAVDTLHHVDAVIVDFQERERRFLVGVTRGRERRFGCMTGASMRKWPPK